MRGTTVLPQEAEFFERRASRSLLRKLLHYANICTDVAKTGKDDSESGAKFGAKFAISSPRLRRIGGGGLQRIPPIPCACAGHGFKICGLTEIG